MKINLGRLLDETQDRRELGGFTVKVKEMSPEKEKEFMQKYIESRREELRLLKRELEWKKNL